MTPITPKTPIALVDSEEIHLRILEARRLRAVFLRDAVTGLLRRLHLVRRPAGPAAARTPVRGPAVAA